MKTKLVAVVMAAVMVVAMGNAEAAKKKKGGLLGNSYASQFEEVTDTSVRVTSRKKVKGSLDEINTPGTTVNKAFTAITDATVVRASVEANNLGFKYIKASGTRDLSKTATKRFSSGQDGRGTTTDSDGNSSNTCPGGICESEFTFAQGHYTTEVELAIEVTFDMYKDLPTDSANYIDVAKVMAQYGL